MSPRTVATLNLGALLVALSTGALFIRWGHGGRAGEVERTRDEAASVVVDATGAEVPVRPYRRIVAGSHVADHLVGALCERERILAVSGNAAGGPLDPVLFDGVPVLERLSDVEALVALGPDLVVVNNFVSEGAVAQLRAAGLEVFDLGEMRGLESFLEDARALATVIGASERGERFARSFEARMRAVAADVLDSERPGGMYLGAHGSFFYGGARGTSYHDVLVYGGARDVASAHVGWPSFTAEQILGLDPEVLLTSAGQGEVVCRRPGLDQLRPCRGEGKIIELPEALLADPGAPMLDAAEALRRALHGERRSPEAPR